MIARGRGRRWRVLETVIELPVVLPPAVAGVALLLAFGRRGLLGPELALFGIGLPFTRAAVVLAQSFVAAPFYVQAAIAAFRRLDPGPGAGGAHAGRLAGRACSSPSRSRCRGRRWPAARR